MKFLPLEYPFKIINESNILYIECLIRRKLIILTPEEWVRQHVLKVLIEERGISKNRIAVERQVIGTKKRFDILIHQKGTALPQMIIECKSYNVQVNQSTLNQIGQYNRALNVPYLVVTNWKDWIAAEIQKGEQKFTFLNSFPKI